DNVAEGVFDRAAVIDRIPQIVIGWERFKVRCLLIVIKLLGAVGRIDAEREAVEPNRAHSNDVGIEQLRQIALLRVVASAEIDVDAGSLVGSLGQREEGDWGDDGAAGVDLVIQQDRARLAVGGGDLEVPSILERAAIDDVEAIDWNRNAQAEAAD